MTPEGLIEVRNVRKTFGDLVAVDDLSLSIHAGEIFALVGPDGAGKTTTMRLICGALSTEGGEIRLNGIDLHRNLEKARESIGYLPQRFSLYGDLTVLENLRFFAEVRGLPRRQWLPRSKEILDFVGLHGFTDRRADALSGGMKQKLGLAAALVHYPKILLLDEPTSGVDALTRQAFWQLLIQLLRDGVAVLISTPYMDEASRCNRVGFMLEGRLGVEDAPDALVRHLQGRIIEIVGPDSRRIERIIRMDPQVEDVQMFGDRLHVKVSQGAARGVMRRMRMMVQDAGGQVERIGLVAPNLEDAFIDFL
jgi:ABC-2 type transport system ATP-binding protein